jgi:hypothetical protein
MALSSLKRRAEQGDIEAMYEYGLAVAGGRSGPAASRA